MKKLFAIIMAVAMIMALSVSAFAADPYSAVPQDETQDVTATYAEATDSNFGTVYYFTVAWTLNATNNLKYSVGNTEYTWDGASMKYTAGEVTGSGWSGEGGYSVKVTNQSNASIKATTSATNTYNLTLTPSNAMSDTEITSAAVSGDSAIAYTDTTTQGTAQEATATYTYAANDTATAYAGSDATFAVGTITVTVSAAG